MRSSSSQRARSLISQPIAAGGPPGRQPRHRRRRRGGQEDGQPGRHGQRGGRDGQGTERGPAQVADDGGVGQAVGRLGGDRPERGQRERGDAPVQVPVGPLRRHLDQHDHESRPRAGRGAKPQDHVRLHDLLMSVCNDEATFWPYMNLMYPSGPFPRDGPIVKVCSAATVRPSGLACFTGPRPRKPWFTSRSSSAMPWWSRPRLTRPLLSPRPASPASAEGTI